MKTLKINDVTYEIKKDESIKNRIEKSTFKDLYDCYKSCSYAKRSIFKEWMEKIQQLDVIKNVGVLSFNSQMFTLGYAFNYNGKKCYAFITSLHNYLYIE